MNLWNEIYFQFNLVPAMESYRWTSQIHQIIISDSGPHQILPGLVLWTTEAEVQKDPC